MGKKFEVTSGATKRCQGWRQEALLRLLENVLAVGENPDELIVYAALGRAARNWQSHDAIVNTLKTMREDETLMIQSGKPIGVVKTHAKAPLVIMANCNMVGQWAQAEVFYDLQDKGLICWGGLTAGAWQYIGSQGVIQGTYEIFMQIAKQYFNDNLQGRFILTAGLGGMGGAQPLAGVMAGAAILTVEADSSRIDKRIETGYLQQRCEDLDEALAIIQAAQEKKEAVSVGLLGNAAEVYPALVERGITPDIVTDQTSAHDLVYGYIPKDMTIAEVTEWRKTQPQALMQASLTSIKAHVLAMLTMQQRGAVAFDNGNLIRTQAKSVGVDNAFDIPVFTDAFLRPLFCEAIGPYRWMALSNNPQDIAVIDDFLLAHFADNASLRRWIALAKAHIPFEGLPSRIAWLGHEDRTTLALAVNTMVADGRLSAPVAFSRDHLDSAAMAHPNIMTENMLDGSDAIADWPLLDAMMLCASEADLVAIHSGGGGYSGYMTSAGVTVIADGTEAAAERLRLSITNDTSLGVMRYADAGYEIARNKARETNLHYFDIH